MSVATALGRGRELASRVAASQARTALAWAAVTLAVLLALGGGPGISRDEAAVLGAADPALLAAGSAPAAAPPLPSRVAAATRAVLSTVGVPRIRAARAGTALLGAVLSAAVALLAWELSGPAAAFLAPALFWAAPRHLHAGLVVSPDLALAALAAALVLAWRRAGAEPDRRRRLRAAVLAGLLFGAALATRSDAWVLLVALACHAVLSRALRNAPSPRPGPPLRGGEGGPARLAGPARDDEGRRAQGFPVALLAMLVLGPLVLLAAWPALVVSPVSRAAALAGTTSAAAAQAGAAARGVLGLAFPLVVTSLTVPAAILVVYAGGLAHAATRIARAVSDRAPRDSARDELLLLLCAVAPLAAAAAGLGPGSPGVRPWLHAMPFLAVLGARALVTAARVSWPTRAAPLAASLSLLALWPAVRATAHAYPSGTASWNELAGGAPGAATRGLPRQDGGDASARLLDEVNARAREGARIWWPSSAPAGVRALSGDGLLRPDLRIASAPEDADLAVVAVEGAGRDPEYRTWTAFRTARPVAGFYLDEVPLAFVYARPGAWR